MGNVMEEVLAALLVRRKEVTEWAAGASSPVQLVLGDSRVLGTGSHIWLCENLGASSPGPNQQSTWAALRLSLQRIQPHAQGLC